MLSITVNESGKVEVKLLSKNNWVTDCLKTEIKSYFPKNEDKIADEINHSITPDRKLFQRQCIVMLLVGRMFINAPQLDKTEKIFCST